MPQSLACPAPAAVVHAAGRAARLLLIAMALLLSGCGYNSMQRQDEATKAAWSEVLNQYQRRADLIPNIVNTVRGEANFEQETLTRVIEARAKVGRIEVKAEDAASLAAFQQAQGELSSALSRLMMVTENYPNLKSDAAFRDLQAQLEGTENRVTVARNRFIEKVAEYNSLIRVFPNNLTAWIFNYDPKPSFTVENEAAISTAPVVDFGAPPKPED